MNERMVGDIYVVVIDEMGEVTFARDLMFPAVVEMSKNESASRCFAAVIELIEVCSTVVPVSPAQFHLMQALESLLAQRKFLQERFVEQVAFNDSLDEAAGSGRLLEGNTYRRRPK